MRLNYFTLCYNDGTVWNSLAMGSVDGPSVTISPTTTDEFLGGKKYALTVYAGDGILFYDASAPAFFQYVSDGISVPTATDGAVRPHYTFAGDWLHLSGLPADGPVSLYTPDGRLLYSGYAAAGRLSAKIGAQRVVIVRSQSGSSKLCR